MGDDSTRAIRMAGPEALQGLRRERDWSHIVPWSKGGSNSASNGIFEESSFNQARSAEMMTSEEFALAQQALDSEAFRHAVTQAASVMVTAALVAAVVEGVFAVMDEGLQECS